MLGRPGQRIGRQRQEVTAVCRILFVLRLATSKKGLCMRCFHSGCWGCSQTMVASTVVSALLAVAAPSARGANRLVPKDMSESSGASCCLPSGSSKQ